MDELYQQIIESYKKTGSVKKTAEELGTYPIKVRRVLITEGLWSSKTSLQVAELLRQGKSVPEIAGELATSEKNVQFYMPYSRGQYGGEGRSNEAIRSEEYRERMHKAAKNQVNKAEARRKNKVNKTEAIKNKESDELKEQCRHLEELRAELERLQEEKKQMLDKVEAELKRIPMALQLHLELDLDSGYADETEREILRTYGRMKDGITRDFIVPGSMTLHGLHYAIMKAFGWQNSHLHSYVPYEDEFRKMTGGKVKEWSRQVGMYFRFPSENYEDIYWDDDYEEGESVKTWLKSKYCAPYFYGGVGEYYLPSQIEVESFRKRYPKIQKKSTDQRGWDVYFPGQCEEMIERSEIWTVLKTPADKGSWDSWKAEKEAALKKVERDRKSAILEYERINSEIEKTAEQARKTLDKNGNPTGRTIPYIRELESLDRKMENFCIENDPKPTPALSALCYRYDYGDGWEIRITCTNAWYDKSVYSRDGEGSFCYDRNGLIAEKADFVDAYGQQTPDEFLSRLKGIAGKGKPVCIAWDGMNLIDDVGGISGFCNFLEKINGKDPEQKKFYKDWARGQGWTGRMSKPENIL